MKLPIPLVAAALAICASTAGWSADQPPPGETPAKPLDEVTVRARRADLETKITKFVNSIAARGENGGEGGLPRWLNPAVCPLVSGLPRQEGEFILSRFSQIATAAKAPLGKERCSPNLYILVVAQPEALLRGMEKRNWRFTFGWETAPSTMKEFITTPRPVRVWYNSDMMNEQGKRAPRGAYVGKTSMNDFGVLWGMSRVFVIVDLKRLGGISRGQFADYISMVSLAAIKPGAATDDTPSILKLFDGSPKDAPAGLTSWDQAYLKSVYTTSATSKLQRGQMVQSMLRDMLPQ